MRPWQRRLLLSLVTVAMSWPAAAPVSAQPTEFKVGISEPVNTVLAIWMADAAGFYAAQRHQGRDHQHERRQPRRRRACRRPHRRHACRIVVGGAAQPHRRRSAHHRVARQRDPLHLLLRRRASRPRPTSRAAWSASARFGSESDSTVTLALQAARAHARRCHAQGIRRRPAAPCRGEVGRDQGHRGQRAVHQHGARAGLQHAGRSRPREHPLAVHRHRGQARRHRRPPRCADAVHPGDRRGQLSGAHRREAGQGGAGQASRHHRSENPRHQLQRFQAALAAEHRADARRRQKTSSRSSPMRARRSRTMSTRGILDGLRKDGVFTALAQKYQR